MYTAYKDSLYVVCLPDIPKEDQDVRSSGCFPACSRQKEKSQKRYGIYHPSLNQAFPIAKSQALQAMLIRKSQKCHHVRKPEPLDLSYGTGTQTNLATDGVPCAFMAKSM